MCDKVEIIKYVKHMSNYVNLDLRDENLSKIPDIKIPYRDLSQLFFVAQYDINTFIDELKKFKLDDGRSSFL